MLWLYWSVTTNTGWAVVLLHQTDTRDIIDLLSPKVLKKAKNDELLWDFYTSLHMGMQDSPFMPEHQIKQTDA